MNRLCIGKRVVVLHLLLISLTAFPSCAMALSCAPRMAIYTAYCGEDVCTEGFVVEERGAFGPCGTKPVVGDIPKWALDVLTKEVAKKSPVSTERIGRLELRVRYWSAHSPNSLAEFNERFRNPDRGLERATVETLESGGRAEFDKMREEAESLAWRAAVTDGIFNILDWALLVAVAAVLLLSGKRVSDQLRFSGAYAEKRFSTVTFQILVAIALVFLAVMSMFYFKMYWALVLLPVLWLYEAGLWSYLRFFRKPTVTFTAPD